MAGLLAKPGRNRAQNEQTLNAMVGAKTPLGEVVPRIDDDFGRASDSPCVIASILVQAGANPLRNDLVFQRNLKPGTSARKVGEITLLLLDLMRQREYTDNPVRSDTGGNAIHAMAENHTHALTDLLHNGRTFQSLLALQWFTQPDDFGDTPLHLMWQGAGMGGICAYETKEEESALGVAMADALWNSLVMGPGGMVDLTSVGSQGKPLYTMILDMVALGVPVREEHRTVHARVRQCAQAHEEQVSLEMQTAPAPSPSSRGGMRL